VRSWYRSADVARTGVVGNDEGLRPNGVIVAVDGIRVCNLAQYRAARGANAIESMRLTVWRQSKYMDTSPRLRYRWAVSSVKTYEPGSPAK
jgi:hypothetical protein